MRKYINWLFGKRKSERKSEDAKPSTSEEHTSISIDLGPESKIFGDEDQGDAASKTRSSRSSRRSSVLQSTVVEDRHSAIPPVTQLVQRQTTAERISKVMDNFDSLLQEWPELKK